MSKLIGINSMALAGLVLASSSIASGATPPKRVYASQCASCHGADGSGNAEMATNTLKVEANLLNLGRKEAESITRDQKKDELLKGKGKMPGYEKKLPPDQVDPVLDYAIQLAEALRKK